MARISAGFCPPVRAAFSAGAKLVEALIRAALGCSGLLSGLNPVQQFVVHALVFD